ncbi:uncharacterized protein E5676_scaffold37G00410 [Cucumis melo var. makuwa]|uniref:Uncharacterized protein n=1 Tax=Cucumis melo var. makuwa TaxID=1194695 RepID=A0A5D3BCV5_CUCMM|nr:uncharacterized protein E6C27_scaffold21G002810 [Cucumis melo var. makuwa]TYJ97670.1 uncharacterized protein E5676_scaffold37G00410 [Cucumis melo var. makuwa]
MIQNTRQFDDHPGKDPHKYICSFYSIGVSFHMPGIFKDELRFALFPFTMSDEAKRWANSLKHGKVYMGRPDWKFMKKFLLENELAIDEAELT